MMKTMHFYELDFDFVKSDDFINRWILFHVDSVDTTLKEFLKTIDVPYTSYAYARKNGFLSSKKVLDPIMDHFGLSLNFEQDTFEALKDLVYRAITESYFIKVENLRVVHDELAGYKDTVKGSPLYTLYALAYLSAFDHFNMEQFKPEIEDEILPFLEYMNNALSFDAQYFYLFSKVEYYFNVDRDDEAIGHIKDFERLDPYVNERLKTMGYFDLFTLYALDENYARCLVYMEKCSELTFKYYNLERLKAIQQNKTAVLFNHESYEEALANARGDLLFIYRNDLQANRMFFKILIVIIVSSLIKLNRFNEALKEANMFFDYALDDYYGQGLLLKAFCYYKLEDMEGIHDIRAVQKAYESEGHDFPDRYYVLFDLIEMLARRKRSEMKTFGSTLKPYRYEQVYHYNRIAKLLEDEYAAYLKEIGSYIEVLDM
ncbi:MAG: hypothetical protein ACOCU0_01475 [Bacillota bacterium]